MAINYVVTKKVDTTKEGRNKRALLCYHKSFTKETRRQCGNSPATGGKEFTARRGCHVGTCTVIRCYR